MEYMQYLKDKQATSESKVTPRPSEKGFWLWFLRHKMVVSK